MLLLKVADNICCVEQCRAGHCGIVTDRYGTKPQLKAGYMALHQTQQELQGKLTWSSKGKETVETATEAHDKECNWRLL